MPMSSHSHEYKFDVYLLEFLDVILRLLFYEKNIDLILFQNVFI